MYSIDSHPRALGNLNGLHKQYISGTWGSTEDCDYDPEKTKPFATLRGFESLPKNDQVTSPSPKISQNFSRTSIELSRISQGYP
jgi:hypothetical protein